jgi:hypothetical protein
MNGEVLLSTAYFPPSVYFSLSASSDIAIIEKWENYHKQTFRNRCTILGANGPISLSVPVLRGSVHKTPIRDIEIDNSLEWRKHHLRSIISAYGTSPYFLYYIDIIEDIVNYKCDCLLDYNLNIIKVLNENIGIKTPFRFSESFTAINKSTNDFRYLISPKVKLSVAGYSEVSYLQVFADRYGFVPGLSIIDTLFNNGPGTQALLLKSLA